MPGRRPTTLSSPANAESAPFYRRRDAEWPTPGPCSWRREQGTVTPPALPGSSGLLPTRTLLEEPRGPRSCASQRFRVALGARQDKAAHGQRAPPLALTLTPSYIGTRGGRWGGGSTVCPPLSTARAPAAPAEARVTRDLVGAPAPFRDDLHFLSPSLLFLKLESTNSVGTRLTPGQPRVTPGFSRGQGQLQHRLLAPRRRHSPLLPIPFPFPRFVLSG